MKCCVEEITIVLRCHELRVTIVCSVAFAILTFITYRNLSTVLIFFRLISHEVAISGFQV